MSNKDVSRKFFDIYACQHDVEGVLQLFADNVVVHSSVIPGGKGDLATYKAVGAAYLAAFPKIYAEVLDQIEEGDKVVTRVMWGGQQTGPLANIPPTGRSFEAEAITIDRIKNGKIVERWETSDLLSQFQQLGVIPMFA